MALPMPRLAPVMKRVFPWRVVWEDTGRFQGSSVGPNISDLTLQVRYDDSAGQPPGRRSCR
jgi:hypothetical protein